MSSGRQIVPAGPFDQRNDPALLQGSGNASLNTRPDVLSFIGDPLESDLEVSGQVSVTLGEAFADRRLPPIVAQNTIHLGTACPSFVSLPVRGKANQTG